jgi:hypothetical protein
MLYTWYSIFVLHFTFLKYRTREIIQCDTKYLLFTVVLIVDVTITAHVSQDWINVTLVRITPWTNFVRFVTLELLGMQPQTLVVSRVIVMVKLIWTKNPVIPTPESVFALILQKATTVKGVWMVFMEIRWMVALVDSLAMERL